MALLPVRAWGQHRSYQRILTPSTPGAAEFQHPTTLALAPDGRLFVAQQNGKIHWVRLNSQLQVVAVGRIDTIYSLGLATGGRTVTGMTFGPNGDLFVSHSDGRLHNANIDTSSGMVTRLFARTSFTTYQLPHVVDGLPRSRTDHGPNSLVFGPDRKLYLGQGGMTNAGLACGPGTDTICADWATFWTAEESAESAAILQIDISQHNVFTVYATGLRNPYDLLWHSNGNLYANDNGSNPGAGERPRGTGSCDPSGQPAETVDELNLILSGQYYGHPNPARGECWFGDGPSVGPIASYGAHTSSDGMAEYTSTVMPELKGQIITANFNNGTVVSARLLGLGTTAESPRILRVGLAFPLDVVVRSTDGAIFVAEYSATGAAGSAVSVLSVTTTNDFDNDRRSELVVFRPSTGSWLMRDVVTGAVSGQNLGIAGDVPLPLDYTGDGRPQLAVWRPSTGEWMINGVGTFVWGVNGDIPVPADFDGDGRADLAVFRPSTSVWWIVNSATGTVTSFHFGGTGDVPRPIDYDGDGRADVTVWRPSTGEWHVAASSTGYQVIQWGLPDDVPVPADFDGDGRTDPAVYRPSTGYWLVLRTATSTFTALPFGVTGDIPRPIDYDGDGRAAFTVWRPSTGEWHIFEPSSGYHVVQWGLPGDIPVHPVFDATSSTRFLTIRRNPRLPNGSE